MSYIDEINHLHERITELLTYNNEQVELRRQLRAQVEELQAKLAAMEAANAQA